jgi:DNA invertase Pin-like site-specific DNA recombinase
MAKKLRRTALRALRRAVIYVRISMDRTMQYSEEIQIDHGKRVAEMLGVSVVDVIIEKDLTGTVFETRRIMEIIDMSRRAEIDGVILIHTNRWGRNSAEAQRHERLLRESGSCLIAGGQIIDTSTAAGKLAFQFNTVVDENGSVLISEAWVRAHDNRHRRGMPHSGRLRLGYTRCPDCHRNPMNERAYVHCKTCDGVLQINESTADDIEEMCRRYGNGESGQALAAQFQKSGFRSAPSKKYPDGKKMSWGDWRNSLDTGFQAGYLRTDVGTETEELRKWAADDFEWELVQDEEGGPSYYAPPAGWRRGKHAPIIGPEVWRRYVERRLLQAQGETRSTNPKYSVSTLVRCYATRENGSVCRSSMSARPRRDSRATSGYIVNFGCRRKLHTGDCEGVQVSLARLEAAVLNWLKANAEGEENAVAAVQRQLSDERDRKKLVQLEKLKEQIEAEQDALALAVAKKSVPERSAEKLTREYEQRLADIETEMKTLAPRVRSSAPPPAEAFEKMAEQWPRLSVDKRRAALRMVVDHIAVRKGAGTSWSVIEIVPAWEAPDGKVKRRVAWEKVLEQRASVAS